VLEGDPSKEGHFTLRFRMPKGYTVDPHWHTKTEYVTVLAGSMMIVPGTVIDENAGAWMGVGSYFAIPGKSPHFAIAGEDDTLIQITGEGPFDLHYVNPDGSEKKSE
jgi:quercetin dioxygenase-like cupin family protein